MRRFAINCNARSVKIYPVIGLVGLREGADTFKFVVGDGLSGKSPLLEQHHIGKCWVRFECLQEYGFGKPLDKLNVERKPARVLWTAFRVEVGALGVELRWVGVGLAHDLGDSHNTRLLDARVIDKNLILRFYLVANKVTGLVIANAVPAARLIFLCSQMFDSVNIWLCFK